MGRRRRKKRKRFGFIRIVLFSTVFFMVAFLGIYFMPYNKFDMLAIGERFSIKDIGVSDEGEWSLLLVNPWNPVPEDFEVELIKLKDGQSVDSRIYPYLQEMFDDARKDGITPVVYSSYRTYEKQQLLYDNEIAEYMAQGYDRQEAENIAKTWVAYPGTSEHQIGLAVDITSENKNRQDPDIVWDWLAKNSYKYGFILRYEEEKTELTGISPEPWHYRYVGKKAAKEIYDQGLCLEEYLENKK